jgi:alpha-tubulin suppressor-like RCC1 family protein
VSSVSGGSAHSLAVLLNGTVEAWGGNSSGQLGDGTNTERHSPIPVPGLTNIVDVETLNESSFALSADGRLWAWGDNSYGELGLGDTTFRLMPTEVLSPLAGYRFGSISGSGTSDHVLAVLVPIPAPSSALWIAAASGTVLARRRRR